MLLNFFRELVRLGQRLDAPEDPGLPDADSVGALLVQNEPARAYERASVLLARNPTDPLLHYQAGLAAFLMGQPDVARRSLEQAVAIQPASFEAHVTLGAVLQQSGLIADALAHYAQAARLRPERAEAHGYAGNMQFQLGLQAAAVASYRRALALDPGNHGLHSNLLFALNSLPGMDRPTLFEAHRAWGAALEERLCAVPPLPLRDTDPCRPLRIGYVSADFRNHSVAYFIEPVWANIDRSRYATFVYDNHTGEADAMTRRLRGLADQWRPVSALSDEDLDRRIREDRIDILVDLSGHTAGNRLPLFARRPAPVQVTWFAYMNTTGLRAIDYRLTDEWLAPPGEERFYSEELVRLPHAACFSPSPDSPPVNALPLYRNAYVTFSSFNSWTKVSDEVIAAWCQILRKVPQSRLLALVQGGGDPQIRTAIARKFDAYGIAESRLTLRPTCAMSEFLRTFLEADIALDTFPYTGGTTTLHTLWMGVPVISMQGGGETGRTGAGILRSMGLADLVASDAEEYCDTAVRLAGDAARMQGMRASLRGIMTRSPIMQSQATTKALEDAFREMWRRRVCAGAPPQNAANKAA